LGFFSAISQHNSPKRAKEHNEKIKYRQTKLEKLFYLKTCLYWRHFYHR